MKKILILLAVFVLLITACTDSTPSETLIVSETELTIQETPEATSETEDLTSLLHRTTAADESEADQITIESGPSVPETIQSTEVLTDIPDSDSTPTVQTSINETSLNETTSNEMTLAPTETVVSKPEATKSQSSVPAPTPAQAETSVPTPTPAPSEPEPSFEQVFALVNDERAKSGLKAYTLDPALTAAANARAVELETLFDHKRPNGTMPDVMLNERGIAWSDMGENIASGQPTAKDVMESWMISPGHYAHIMSSEFTRIGIGYHKAANGITYWVQLFVTP